MTKIITLEDIKPIINQIDLIQAMEQGFKAYSNGTAVIPPVGELLFDQPKGDAHIKYGYLKDTEYYVIKIASGFYENPKLNLSSSQGMMLLFSQKTGVPIAVLLDEGYLTDLRTAAAGALSAKYFAPKKVTGIGIIGNGIQARLQLDLLNDMMPNQPIWVWGRNSSRVKQYCEQFDGTHNIQVAQSPNELAQHCNLIVTTTPSEEPILSIADIQPGTHITAVGSDTKDKQELDSAILNKADIVIADSIAQCKSRGEIYQALKAGAIQESSIVELGHAIQNKALQRQNDQQITVTDLTGVAVQDIMITSAVYETLNK